MSTTDAPAERRCSPRLDASGLVHGQLASVHTRVTVAEVGLGGFSVVTAFPLEVGSLYRFRFSRSLGDDTPARVRARAVYSRRLPADDPRGTFLTGLAFISERPRDRKAIGQLLDHVMSPLSLSAF